MNNAAASAIIEENEAKQVFAYGDEQQGDSPGGHRHHRPCGRGKDHPGRGHALPHRSAAEAGPGGPRQRRHGQPSAGAGAGHYHFSQPGGAASGGHGGDAAGHPGPCGLFRRDGADPVGAGLCHPGHQRRGRGPGPHPHPVAAAGAVPGAHVSVRDENGLRPPRPGRPDGEPSP